MWCAVITIKKGLLGVIIFSEPNVVYFQMWVFKLAYTILSFFLFLLLLPRGM